MPRILFHRIFTVIPFFLTCIAAKDYYPLSVGSRWYYRYNLPENPPIYHEYQIVSDTIIGQRHYFARKWSSSTSDTAMEWLYVSGNDVYKLTDLAKPDTAVKITQKNFTTGDSWIDGSGLVGDLEIRLVVSFKGQDTVPAGVFDSTWSAYGADTDTLAGGLLVVRNSIKHLYADGIGEIGAIMVVLGTIHSVLLDSFYIAPDAGIQTKQRLCIQAEAKRMKCLTIMESAGTIGRNTAQLYTLNGRLFNHATINQASLRQRLPSGMLIAIPGKHYGSNMH
jgi:hypothetical protein